MEALEQYDVENPKYEMTDYANWVRKGELKADRALEAGFDVDYNNGNVIDKTGAVVDNIYDDNTNAAPELSTLISKEAKKLKVGDVLHDDAGNRLGLVTKVKRAPGKTGVILDNGNRIPFNNNDPINVASTRTVAQQAKVGTVGKKAAKLELGTTPDGKTAKKLAVNPEDASIAENVTPIKGNSKKKALKPTKEATDAKNKVVELGKEVWEKSVEPKMVEILKAKGYDVDSMVDIDQLSAAAKKAADDEGKKFVDAGKKISKYLEDQIKKITPAELSKLEPSMTADKLIKSNGSRDVLALEKRLRDAGFSGLASDIAALPSVSKKEDEVAHSKLFAFGYKMLNSKNAAQIDKLQSLYSDKDKANKSRIEAVKKFNDVDRALGLAEKDATLQAMKDEGVEFDNVSIREFEGRIISHEKGLPLEPGNTFLSSRALNEAFENMPRSMILQLVEHLKSTNQTLKIRAGVKRGHFATVPGGYELDLSAIPNPLPGQTKHTSTAGHEIMHFMQEVIPNLRTLEHAWSYDRLLQNKGTADETLPNIMGLPGKKTELTFAAPGMSALYTFKQYSKNKEIFLNPHDKSSEVASTIFEDMFTNPGYVSRSKGNTVVSKEPGKAKKLYKDAVFDEATQTWYTDESLVTPIPNVVGEYGRRKSDGVDKNVKHFGIGLFMALNDWSSTGSTGTTPRKPRKKK